MYCIQEYTELIEALLSKGYIFKEFLSPGDQNTIYLRHDIDFSIKDAFQIANIEKELGIKSNYFFMINSNFYNCFSTENYKLIRFILDFGHTISLHFDPSCHLNLEEGFKLEKRIFESSFNMKIKLISLHKPRLFLNNNNKKIGDCYHTYEDKFFREMHYYSDSGGKDVSEIIKKLSPEKFTKPIQLLLHPIWWTQKSSNPTERLTNFLEQHKAFLEEEISANCKTFLK